MKNRENIYDQSTETTDSKEQLIKKRDFLRKTGAVASSLIDLIVLSSDRLRSFLLNRLSKEELVIYENVFNPDMISDKSIQKRIEPYLNSITPEMAHKIIDSFGIGSLPEGKAIDFKRCNHVSRITIKELSNILDIKKRPLFKVGQKKEGKRSGSYVRIINTIFMDFPKGEKVETVLDTLGHEMWHAFQYRVREDENSPDKIRKLYDFNCRFYAKSTKGFKTYRDQLIEREAFCFGKEFARAIIDKNEEYYADYDIAIKKTGEQ